MAGQNPDNYKSGTQGLLSDRPVSSYEFDFGGEELDKLPPARRLRRTSVMNNRRLGRHHGVTAQRTRPEAEIGFLAIHKELGREAT